MAKPFRRMSAGPPPYVRDESAPVERQLQRARSRYADLKNRGLLDLPNTAAAFVCRVCGIRFYDVAFNPLRGVSYELHHPDLLNRPEWVQVLCARDHRRVHAGEVPEPDTGRLYSVGAVVHLLGSMPDAALARMAGVARSTVTMRRQRLGIPACPRQSA